MLFQFIFIAALCNNLNELEQLYEGEVRNRNIMTELNRVLSKFLTIAGNQAIYQVTKNKVHGNSLERDMAEVEVDRLKLHNMIATDKKLDKQLVVFDEVFKAMHDAFSQGSMAVLSQDKLEAAVAYAKIYHLVNRSNALSRIALAEMDEEHRLSELAQKQARDRVTAIVGGGMACNLVLMAGLLFFLNNMTARRFEHLTKNIAALAAERSLTAPLTGKDDIAKLDKLLHQVAGTIADARRKEKAVIDNAGDIICSIDPLGKISSINPACQKLWQMNEEELTGKSLASLVDKNERENFAAMLQNLIAGKQSGSFEMAIQTGSGNKIEMLWNTQWSEEMNNLFCVAHDITARKEAERLKQEVMAMVSHDLRSPLTSLQLTLNLLSSGALGSLSPKALDRVARAEDSIASLIGMISDLLDMEKLQSGLFILEPSEVKSTELLTKACALLDDLARGKNVELVQEAADFKLNVDGPRVVRVLTNLIGNAIKFAPPGSKVKIVAKQQGDTAYFSVSDNGPGIKPEDREAIFERFKQLRAQDENEKSGSGLGLPICKAIVQAHKGEIGLEQVSKGSKFWFKLPV